MRKVCVVTAARSEYGPLRWVIDRLYRDCEIELLLVVTGAHLLESQGSTYRDIERDGYPITDMVDMELDTSTAQSIARSMGVCGEKFANVFDRLKPDLIVVAGDRYELLPICSTALVMNIPIAHISGGDVTEGAIDDAVRNAVTMMADLHFAGNAQSAKNIERMRASSQNVYDVGEPGLENFLRLDLMSRDQLAENLSIDVDKKWVLMTYHPQTRLSLEKNLETVSNTIAALNEIGNIEVVVTKANADFGGEQINDYLQTVVDKNPAKFHFYASLGQLRYLSFIKQAALVVGNSSSGILEAPFCGTPTINIGDRQTGRYMCGNVVQSGSSLDGLTKSIKKCLHQAQQEISDTHYYGDGHTAAKIIEIIKQWR